MVHFKGLLLVSLLILNLSLGFSQETSERKANELDERYEPNSSSTFNASKQNKSSSFHQSQSVPNNFIKYSPTYLFRRKVTFFYGLALADRLTLDLGLGKAFGIDPIENAGITLFSIDDYEEETITPSMFHNESYYAGSSPFVTAGIRFYLEDEAFEGYYLMTSYRFEKQVFKLDATMNNITVQDPNRTVDLFMNGFLFGYGYSWLAGKNKNLLSELEVSFGVKFYKYTKYIKTQTGTNSYGSADYAYIRSGNQMDSKMQFAINITYCIGIGF